MLYSVYTDGSVDEAASKIASTFLIYTDDSFIALDSALFKGKFSSIAETLAIGVAAQYILRNLDITKDGTVVFHTDSRSSKIFLKNHLDEEEDMRTPNDQRVKIVVDTMKLLTSKCNVEFKKVKAHEVSLSGNNVVDRIAKLSLMDSYKCLQ